MTSLTGKTALIIGGLHPLATGVAQSLTQAGAQVIVAQTSININLDDAAVLQAQIAALPPIDIAIISPSNFSIKPFVETTDADWDAALTGNFERSVWAAQAVARTWVAQNRPGSIIFLSWVAGQMPHVNMSALGTSLGALRALAKMAAVDLGLHDITLNVIESGWADLEAFEPYLHDAGREQIKVGTPTLRLVQPAEVGALCCFLASARSITGQCLTIDGGYALTPGSGSTPFMPEHI